MRSVMVIVVITLSQVCDFTTHPRGFVVLSTTTRLGCHLLCVCMYSDASVFWGQSSIPGCLNLDTLDLAVVWQVIERAPEKPGAQSPHNPHRRAPLLLLRWWTKSGNVPNLSVTSGFEAYKGLTLDQCICC